MKKTLCLIFFAGQLLFAKETFASPPKNAASLMENKPSFFEENKGQVTGADAGKVNYMYRGQDLSVFVLKSGLAYQFNHTIFPAGYKMPDKMMNEKERKKMEELGKQIRTETYRMDLALVGTDTNAVVTEEGKSPDFINYYNHNAPGVHSYRKLTYHNVYPGIDWVIYKTDQGIKYDFVVRPGGNPAAIKLRVAYAEAVQLNKDGGITLKSRMGDITEQAPVSFQEGRKIKTGFVQEGNNFSFRTDKYDPAKTLVIDPTLVWATYYDGPNGSNITDCATDQAGNIYFIGSTSSATAIASGGYQNTIGGGSDAMIVKFNPAGARKWASYFGGSGTDYGVSCAVTNGILYIAGNTNSATGITSSGHQTTLGGSNDAFLARFDTTGAFSWATYYGGSGDDQGTACAADQAGNVYLAGYTASSNNISYNGYQNARSYPGSSSFPDGFLVKFDNSGVRQWGTYYGPFSYQENYLRGCAVTPSGSRVFVVGNVLSGSASYSDGTYIAFDAAGAKKWDYSYGNGNIDAEGFSCVTTDNSGNLFIGGTHIPYYNSYADGYIGKCDTNGTGFTYYSINAGNSTYPRACSADASGNVYVAGYVYGSTSTLFLNPPSYGNDAFLVKVNSSLAFKWGLYYGGTGGGTSGMSCAVVSPGYIYLAGNTSATSNIAYNGYQNTLGSIYGGGYLAKFNDTSCTVSLTVAASANNICAGTSVTYTATPTNGGTTPAYQWKVNGTNVGTNVATYTYTPANGDAVTCVLTSNASCASATTATSNSVTMTVNATVTPAVSIAASANNICAGTSVTYTATPTNGGTTPGYQWKVNGTNVGTNAATYAYSPTNGDAVTCVLTSNATCASTTTATSNSVTMTVNATVTPAVSIAASANNICAGTSVTYTATPTNGGTTPAYQWKVNGTNVGTNAATYTYTPANGDAVTCVLTSNATCASTTTATSNSVTMTVNATVTPAVSIAAAANNVCAGTSVTYTATPTNGGATPAYQWKVNGTNVGTNAATYAYTPANGDIITCVLTSNATCASATTATSNSITMTVNATVTPAVSIAASANNVCAGTSVTYTATPTNGGATPAYQWKVNGTNVGTNAATYTYTPANGDAVTCVLTSNATCASATTATSNSVTMTVNATVTPAVSIAASANNICAGTSVTYTATPTNGGTTPAYQWKVNGTNVGTNAATYTYTPANGDAVTCVLTSNATCASATTATSNSITMTVNATVTPAVSIAASANNICAGTSVTYTATPTNGGTTPAYQWKINGVNAGPNVNVYPYTPANGDVINCILTSNATCAATTTATSNSVTMTVNAMVTPAVSIVPSANNVCAGTSVTFTATPTNGGTAPAYQWSVNGINGGITVNPYTYTPTNGDIVTCLLTSNATCTTNTSAGSNSITMVTTQPVSASIALSATPPAGVIPGTPVVYTAVVNNAPSYTIDWYRNGVFATSSVSPVNTHTFTAGNTADTVLAVLKVNGCYTDTAYNSNKVIVTIARAGVKELAHELGIHVFPNPTDDILHITTEQGAIDELQLINTLGQAVTLRKQSGSKADIDLTGFASGIYQLHIVVIKNNSSYIITEKVQRK